MSDFLRNARDFVINGGNFNQIQGDQYNYTTQVVRRRNKELEGFEDVYVVKRSAICRTRDVHIERYPRRWDEGKSWHKWDKGPRADRIICIAELDKRRGRVFTVVSYTGPEARKAFLEDYQKYSTALTAKTVQVYAVDAGSIPSLVLYHELMPLAHFAKDFGLLGRIYFLSLLPSVQYEFIWMDPNRGMLCQGPSGPEVEEKYIIPHYQAHIYSAELPWKTELLQEDVFLRFLASARSKTVDLEFVEAIGRLPGKIYPLFFVENATVRSTLTNTPIAVASPVWHILGTHLTNRKLLVSGWERLTLEVDGWDGSLYFTAMNANSDWMSQAWSIFDARKAAKDDDFSIYELVFPVMQLTATRGEFWPRKYQNLHQRPVYLFVAPPSLPDVRDSRGLRHPWYREEYITSSLHHWSYNEDGASPLSPEACRGLGLPFELEFTFWVSTASWPNHTYKILHQYQVLRGFDPTTTDFARYLGCRHDFKAMTSPDDSTRFKEFPPTPPDPPFWPEHEHERTYLGLRRLLTGHGDLGGDLGVRFERMFSAPSPPPPPPSYFGLGSEYFAMCDRFVEDVTTPDNSIQFKKTSAPMPPIGPSSPANSDLEGEIDLIIRTMERLSLDSPAPQSPANLASV